MTHRQWLEELSKEDAVFRLLGKLYFKTTCLECVMYKPDQFGKYKCTSDTCDQCWQQFEEWLDEEME